MGNKECGGCLLLFQDSMRAMRDAEDAGNASNVLQGVVGGCERCVYFSVSMGCCWATWGTLRTHSSLSCPSK